MPVIDNINISDAEKDDLLEDFYSTMKAKEEDMHKVGAQAPWRKHFRIAMCVCIG